MNESSTTAWDRLDRLRAEGKIDAAEYEDLRRSMSEPPRPGIPSRPSLRRTRADRMLGGVCGGIAVRMGVESWKVRGVAALMGGVWASLAILAYIIWRVRDVAVLMGAAEGLLASLVYIALWIAVPLNPAGDREKNSVDPLSRKEFWVGGGAILLFGYLPSMILIKILPLMVEVFANHGRTLPPVTAITLRLGGVIMMGGYLFALPLPILLLALYLNAPRRRVRGLMIRIIVWTSILLTAVVVTGMLLPYVMPTR